VDRMTLNNFVAWLQNRGYSPKTVRTYVGAVQSLAKYFDVSISLRYVLLPPAQLVNGTCKARNFSQVFCALNFLEKKGGVGCVVIFSVLGCCFLLFLGPVTCSALLRW
jgi:hypothetical protein